MGISERKQRHRNSMKEEILDTAKFLFINKGYEATSIRKIANEMEISPTTIYLYYKDKAEIAFGLHQVGFRILLDKFAVLLNIDNPMERLKAIGKTYIQFALENQDYYELMFIKKDPLEHAMCIGNGEWEDGLNAFVELTNNVKACQEIGYFPKIDAYAMALLIWSSMHGLCSLHINEHLHFLEKNPSIPGDFNIKDLLNKTFNSFIQVLENYK